MKPHPLVVVGSLNMDLVFGVERAPDAGETVSGHSFALIPGGKGANQAVACARLGGRVAMIGRIGTDEFGARLRQGLLDDDIAVDALSVDCATSTGVALIAVERSGQNRIVIVPGANATLTPAHIDEHQALIASASMLLLQLETPLDTVERAIAWARRAGRPVLLNPAPARALPSSLLANVDYLVPNETEASLLTGINVVDIDSAKNAASVLLGQRSKHVLITLGAQGVLIADQQGSRVVAAPRVVTVDSTAAGDTFIGALAVALTEGAAIDDAAAFAVKAASLSVTRHGAQTSIPSRAEVI